MIARTTAPSAPRSEPRTPKAAPSPDGEGRFADLMGASAMTARADPAPHRAAASQEPAAMEGQAAALIAQVAPAPGDAGTKTIGAAESAAPSDTDAQPVGSESDLPGAQGADALAIGLESVPAPATTVAAPPPAPAPVAPPSATPPSVHTSAPPAPGRAAVRAGASAAAAAPEPLLDAAPIASGASTQPFVLPQATAAAALDTLSVDLGPGAPTQGDLQIGRQLDLAQDHAWLDRLAQDIASSAGDASRIRFALAPEHLGRLMVEIANGADGTAVRMTTETEQAQRILADAQPRLVAEARAQGLRIAETNVDLDQRSGGQQHSGASAQQASMTGGGGQNGDRPRSGVPWVDTRRSSLEASLQSKAVANDLYA
jgi:hypothetical protein